MKADAAAGGKRRVPRRPDIYLYVQDLGIDPSLIRSHYELPIDMVASSRNNKSRQGITIRKNKQPVSIDQSSNSHEPYRQRSLKQRKVSV